MRFGLQTFLFLFLVLSVSQASGEVYSWTDEDGIRHFSNISPPAGKEVEKMPESMTSELDNAPFMVTKVFDGDTVEVRGEVLEFRIRLVAIDSPETGGRSRKGQPYSQRAKSALAHLIQGKHVRLKQYGTGGYNRILAEIFCQGENINLIMVQKGLAEVYQGRLPDQLNVSAYQDAEKRARSQRKGVWAQGRSYKSPRVWRKENPR